MCCYGATWYRTILLARISTDTATLYQYIHGLGGQSRSTVLLPQNESLSSAPNYSYSLAFPSLIQFVNTLEILQGVHRSCSGSQVVEPLFARLPRSYSPYTNLNHNHNRWYFPRRESVTCPGWKRTTNKSADSYLLFWHQHTSTVFHN